VTGVARLARSTFPEYGVWHATTRGVERRKVYLDRDDGREFLAQLWRAVDRFQLHVYALCLMPTTTTSSSSARASCSHVRCTG